VCGKARLALAANTATMTLQQLLDKVGIGSGIHGRDGLGAGLCSPLASAAVH
jgi:hypothetical protein